MEKEKVRFGEREKELLQPGLVNASFSPSETFFFHLLFEEPFQRPGMCVGDVEATDKELASRFDNNNRPK